MSQHDPFAPNADSDVPINTPTPVNGQVFLAEYDPTWPVAFEAEAAIIRDALGDRAVTVEHMGSTSVPGLCAKPIIDIALGVPDSADEDAYLPDLVAAGFVLRIREPEWHEHRVFKSVRRNVNMHVWSSGAEILKRHLAFRDWLRTHPADRDRYAAAKRDLASRHWDHIQQYADAKDDIVASIHATIDAHTGEMT